MKANRSLGFFLSPLQKLLFFLLQKCNYLVRENELAFYFTLCIVQLSRLLLDRVRNCTLLFKHFVDYSASLCDV